MDFLALNTFGEAGRRNAVHHCDRLNIPPEHPLWGPQDTISEWQSSLMRAKQILLWVRAKVQNYSKHSAKEDSRWKSNTISGLTYSIWVIDAGTFSYSVIISIAFAHFAALLSYSLSYWPLLISGQSFICTLLPVLFHYHLSCRKSFFFGSSLASCSEEALNLQVILLSEAESGSLIFIKLGMMLP